MYFGASLVIEIRTNRQGAEFYAAIPAVHGVAPRAMPAPVSAPAHMPLNAPNDAAVRDETHDATGAPRAEDSEDDKAIESRACGATETNDADEAIDTAVGEAASGRFSAKCEMISDATYYDFAALRREFPSIVGWIQAGDAPASLRRKGEKAGVSASGGINYPIMQGCDNDFYLHHLPDGARHAWGSIFLDYRNAADFSDAGILIYGHNMRAGHMFGSLRNYEKQDFFDAHSDMFIFTPERDFVLKLFAGYVIDASVEVPPMRFENEARFDEFIRDVRRRSFFSSDVIPTFGDTIVFLCTCTDGANIHGRLIVAGVLT